MCAGRVRASSLAVLERNGHADRAADKNASACTGVRCGVRCTGVRAENVRRWPEQAGKWRGIEEVW